jgi:hypothetical protein
LGILLVCAHVLLDVVCIAVTLQAVFDLPSRMRAALEEDALDSAVSFYAEALPLLKKHGHKGAFRSIAAEADAAAKEISSALKRRLAERKDETEQVVLLLRQLGEGDDTLQVSTTAVALKPPTALTSKVNPQCTQVFMCPVHAATFCRRSIFKAVRSACSESCRKLQQSLMQWQQLLNSTIPMLKATLAQQIRQLPPCQQIRQRTGALGSKVLPPALPGSSRCWMSG